MSEIIKLSICIPTAGMVRAGFAYSLAGLVAKLSQGVPTRPEAGLDISIDVQESSVIHSNRELLVKRAITSEKTHVLFLDDDMVFEPQILDVMLGRRQPVVAVNYLIKTFPLEFVAVAESGRRIVTEASSTGLQEMAYSGFGVSLFEIDVWKRTPQPWFQPQFVPEADAYTTEDNPCYAKIRAAGFKCYLDHDASKLVDHMGHAKYGWRMYKRPEKPAVKVFDEKETA